MVPSPFTGRPIEPAELLRLEASAADELLDRLEAAVPVSPAFVSIPNGPATEATVFGDTHGDWRCTLDASAAFRADPLRHALIGLGDYIDRAPSDCGEGSVANALYLLQLVAQHPGRVLLLQGNHETHRRIAVLPHDLPEEVDQLWGPVEERYLRLLGLLERGPIAARTESGIYLAHGGFPLELGSLPFPQEFARMDHDRLVEVVWGEPSVNRASRGIVRPFDERMLESYLHRSGTRVMLRGHDPDLTGRPLFQGRCLTLQTCRLYERFGGVIVAEVPLDRTVERVSDLGIRHLEVEGRSFSDPT